MTSRPKRGTSGSLTREKFLLPEACAVAGLRLACVADEEIVRRAVDDNLFQFPTTRVSANLARCCLARLDSLGNEQLASLLASGTPEQKRQVNIYMMMRHYELVRVFMVSEIGARFENLDYSFTKVDMNAFFTRYQCSDPKAAKWADSTVKRIKAVLMTVLYEGGYLSSAGSTALVPLSLDYDVECGIRANGDSAWLPAFNRMEV